MGYLLVRRLASVRSEYEAANAALRFVAESWDTLAASSPAALSGVPLSNIQEARGSLERTYQTRLFSEFEQILKQYIKSRGEMVPGMAEPLINKVAGRKRANIPNEIRDAVHEVRDYRNEFVHSGNLIVPPVTFGEALSALNKFVSKLPDPKSN
jgi:hypothetical protein